MSTTNHNILYFFSVCRIRPLNMGICLWKAQNRLSGRGFSAGLAPKLVQRVGRLSDLPSIKSLASMGAIHKRQNRCRLCAFLCELWTTPPILLITSKVGAVHGTCPGKVRSDRRGRSNRQAALCSLERRASGRHFEANPGSSGVRGRSNTPDGIAAMLFGW